MKEEYEKLMELLKTSERGEKFNLEEILQQAVQFFEQLRKSFPAAPKEEKEEMLKMMQTLHLKIQEMAKLAATKAGMTENELSAYGENPSNFSPEMWSRIQETKAKLHESTKGISQVVEGKKDKEESQKPHPRIRRNKRSKWIKS
ncbi:MAG: hypothetical protein L0207_00045 [Chlamydiae bacterium]|nr:hypothetical protein [Chlamydiota bacterium]